ncbi:MAG TPA: TonB-dependent receptor plug domain-containing protein [Saprospiraceae bacterium]|nr:TonB-dependent receptor plug domain-containing protein [Saprospiraceae bacterium]HMP24740.1 TonB-dependent receptor plug domain-containing protein [Saprospiraceae bacterium]
MKNCQLPALFILLLCLAGACTIQRSSAVAPVEKIDNTPGVYQSLADYLRRIPSVRIAGTGEDISVYVRGTDTFTGEREPLFVIDGSLVGESYASAVRLVDVNDIRTVQVLTATDATAQYGLRGNKGAVVIRTKSR